MPTTDVKYSRKRTAGENRLKSLKPNNGVHVRSAAAEPLASFEQLSNGQQAGIPRLTVCHIPQGGAMPEPACDSHRTGLHGIERIRPA